AVMLRFSPSKWRAIGKGEPGINNVGLKGREAGLAVASLLWFSLTDWQPVRKGEPGIRVGGFKYNRAGLAIAFARWVATVRWRSILFISLAPPTASAASELSSAWAA